LQRLPQSQRSIRFLQLWTSKEAYLKARRTGLRREPSEIAAEIGSDGHIRIVDPAFTADVVEGKSIETTLSGAAIIATYIILRGADR